MPAAIESKSQAIIETSLRRRLRRRLALWYRDSCRDLPWRRTPDPYAIWVSEIMLQQTQVATVIPYFERFLKAFPTISALARADEAQVLRLWEGLGYYRRARNLHRAAQQLAAENAGVFPDDPELVRRLPGVGRYTANAILSQAFERRLPILEANSLRVLCRLFARDDDPRRGSGQAWLWQAAEELLPEREVGDFNQALMELGALVCSAESPSCGVCPLAGDCLAHRQGRQAEIPRKAAQPTLQFIDEVAVVPSRRGRVLLVQRPATGRWASLWEFPHGPVLAGEIVEEAGGRVLRALTGLRGEMESSLITLRYSVTHHRFTMKCLRARVTGRFQPGAYQHAKWLSAAELADFPVSSPQRRLIHALTR